MDYEKKYKEALERARQFFEKPYLEDSAGIVGHIFPELEESEDEQHRKWILEYLYDGLRKSDEQFKDHFKAAIAWLEKKLTLPKWKYKKDHTPLLRDSLILNKYGCVAKSPSGAIVSDVWVIDYDELAKLPKEELEKQGEQKPANLKTKAGNWYICDMEVMNENMVTAFHRDEIYYCPKDGYLDVGGALFEVGCLDAFRLATEKEITQPQPKQEWSEEDIKKIDTIIGYIASSAGEKLGVLLPCIDWLKSLKDRVQPKQEWSKEDEKMIESLTSSLYRISTNTRTDSTSPNYTFYNEINWLKSLRPQPHWKPSDEQMHYLSWIANIKLGDSVVEQEVSKHLNELFEDLKKLREE